MALQAEAAQAAEGAIEYKVCKAVVDLTVEHMEWFYTWKHRSYGTHDEGRQVRVKKEPMSTAVNVTQWNRLCRTTSFARDVQGNLPMGEACIDIDDAIQDAARVS